MNLNILKYNIRFNYYIMELFINPNNIQLLWSMLIEQPPFNTFHLSSSNIQTIRNIFESNLTPFFSQYKNKQLMATDVTNANNGFIHTLIKFIHTSRPDLLTIQNSPPLYHQSQQHNPPQNINPNININERLDPINTRIPNGHSQISGTKEDYKTQNADSLKNAVANRINDYTTMSQETQMKNNLIAEQQLPPTTPIEAEDIQKLIMQRNYDINPNINTNGEHYSNDVNNLNNTNSTVIEQPLILTNDDNVKTVSGHILENCENDIKQLSNKIDAIYQIIKDLSEHLTKNKKHKKNVNHDISHPNNTTLDVV